MSMPSLTIIEALRATGLDPVDARILLQHVLGVGHAHLIAHSERRLTDVECARYRDLVHRRRAGEPDAYLVGWREFFGRRYQVGPEVLIPRPETELLVEVGLARMPMEAAWNVLDLGTGSGNVALTLALERPRARVTAVDASAAALARAQANAVTLAVGNVDFRYGDWFGPVAGMCFDLIVANPPYVSARDPHLAQGDVRFEPRQALVGGDDGLTSVRWIASHARSYLCPGGWLFFEHGYDQEDVCAALLAAAGFVECVTHFDLAGHPRVIGARGPALVQVPRLGIN